MFAAWALGEGGASSLEPAESSTAQPLGPTRQAPGANLGDFSEPQEAVSHGHPQGSPPLLLPASPRRTISVSWTRPGVAEVPRFLCWSLRLMSCWRVVPAWGLLSLGFSPTAKRRGGRKRPEISQMAKTGAT